MGMSVHHVCACSSKKPGGVNGSLCTEVIDGYEPPQACWELMDSGPLGG